MVSNYFIEAFEVGKEKAIMRREYGTMPGLMRGFRHAVAGLKADFITIRRIEK
ncbi:hypothetical protein ES702_02139 [subsurface metagenome]